MAMGQQIENIVGLLSVAAAIVTVVLVVGAMIFSRGEKSVKPIYYKTGDKWTFGPLLISAIDEPDVGPHLSHAVSDPIELIGGKAHDRW